jgi:uncharacterized membrane protein
MRVSAKTRVTAPIDRVWSLVADPVRALDYMSGTTRWEVASEPSTGVGAKYRILFQVGSAEVGGLVEVVEFAPPYELAWTSLTGVDQRGRWRLRALQGGLTAIELRIAYGVAGSGLSGWVAERVAAPAIRGHVRRSVQQLGRLVEYEQLRDAAAQRRAGAR